jgi:hypothetical protein
VNDDNGVAEGMTKVVWVKLKFMIDVVEESTTRTLGGLEFWPA